MQHSEDLVQDPAPGVHRIYFCGDVATFRLTARVALKGSAWIRTNIGHAGVTRAEVIRSVHLQETPLGRDWFDTPMRRVDENRFEVSLPLFETGHFEAKCFFLREGETAPTWPPGSNAVLNVEPAQSCGANIIYNAFVRQFGANKSGRRALPPPGEECLRVLDESRWTAIPPSGTFRDLKAQLDFILGDLGCRILMLLPIHPTPTTYGRMGRFGSPYAALSFRGVDPALAVFDPKATPMEQFIELVDEVHRRNARIFLDIAINHTGWAANLHMNHPEWLARTAEGRIEVPGAWGVQWEDLTKLDYRHQDLWKFMAEVFLTWCRRGVDGFRCDAGYMVPHDAWKYIVAAVRAEFPDTTFLLEGLGGKISVTRELLNTANLNWAYSELFQNYDRTQIEGYLPGAIEIAEADGICVHFAETHDNPRLAARSHVYARMRTALCALASHEGAFGFANGVEWLAEEKINVHEAASLNWGSPVNQVAEIGRLARILKRHPAFRHGTEVRLIERGGGNQLALLRRNPRSGERLLVLVNLDSAQPTTAGWAPADAGISRDVLTDLLTGASVPVSMDKGLATCALDPGRVFCLSPDPADLKLLENDPADPFAPPPHIVRQRLRAKALQALCACRGTRDVAGFDLEAAARQLQADPAGFCAGLGPAGRRPGVTAWLWPRDLRREVMIPPGHFLLVRSERGFRARLVEKGRTRSVEDGLAAEDGSWFALFAPLPAPRGLKRLRLLIRVHEAQETRHAEATLWLLTRPENARVKRVWGRSELLKQPMRFLSANGRGGMLRAPVSWGSLASRYDALIAANLHPDCPEDRWVMLARCRAWVVYQGYSQDINLDSLQRFVLGDGRTGTWQYEIPAGQGQHLRLTLAAEMLPDRNALRLVFTRVAAGEAPDRMPDATAVRLILRPDIEDRSFHETTKAFTGPEHRFRQAVAPTPEGFVFRPDPGRCLRMELTGGRFHLEPEWQYMVFRAQEAERGLDPHSDLFSPGYFEVALTGGQTVEALAEVAPAGAASISAAEVKPRPAPAGGSPEPAGCPPLEILESALDAYVVRRGELKTVIAGYPWFLDWGRDSLIFVRGLIAAGRFEDARAVLRLFGQYEEGGTLPNMIRGADAGNRDTSDAPLWFAVACSDLVAAEGHAGFLKSPCGGRPVKKVLESIVRSYIAGTKNGVKMDPGSGLIYSPSHFTWMDTNYPAGSPRQGYPVEIQALWHAALGFMARIDRKSARRWEDLAAQVREAVTSLYLRPSEGWLSDCLHAEPGQPAGSARGDDALRPNQLLAVTLGTIDPGAPPAAGILAACEELLVPGAIRSLADRPVAHAIAVTHNGALLNDPHHPYRGTYGGDEDTSRKPAYHNGTAWTWPFPSYCEALAMIRGEEGRHAGMALLTSSMKLLETGCLGHLPEIVDGDRPHAPRGCDAQAWGASEWVRVWRKLAGRPS
jgi:predicted glycogen debranching enzyme